MTAGRPHFRTAFKRSCCALAALLVASWCTSALAQELSPRLYWPAPVGTQVLVAGYQRSSGDVLMDPSIPVYGVDSKIDTLLLGYVRTFDVWGRTSNLLLELPYSSGTTEGFVEDNDVSSSFAGFNDVAISMTINLFGAPAMTVEGFQALRENPGPIVGLNFKLVPPTGYYDDGRLINVGSNRWAGRIQVGSILPLRPRWLFELAAGAWFFTDDNEFVNGRRQQEPIYAVEAHLIRRFSPGFWLALDANYFTGGAQTIGGNELVDLQRNSRIGATLTVPFQRRHALKLVYSTGTRTRFGNDFNQFVVAYQRLLH